MVDPGDKYNSDESGNDVDGDGDDDADDNDDDDDNDNDEPVDPELQEPGGFPGESGQTEEHHTGLDKEPHTDGDGHKSSYTSEANRSQDTYFLNVPIFLNVPSFLNVPIFLNVPSFPSDQ